MKRARLFLYSVLLILFDQFTKYLATIKLKDKAPFDVIPNVFQFYYHENTGSAFGMFGGKTVFLLIFTTLLFVGILFVYFRLPAEKKYGPLRVICLFLIAGAVGNMIDRFVYHYVVDFLYFELIDFPIFNVADCYITVSAFVLILLSFFYYKEEDFENVSATVFRKKKSSNEE